MSDLLPVPTELVWDYADPPADLMWRLQRLGAYFPLFGRDRLTVRLLHEHQEELGLADEIRVLIGLYEEAWRERMGDGPG